MIDADRVGTMIAERCRVVAVAGVIGILVFAGFGAVAQAQQQDCVDCHDQVSLSSTAHPELVCGDCHTNVPAEHDGPDLSPLTDADSCGGCHRRESRTVGRSVHESEAGCNDCHGEPHAIQLNAELGSAISPVNQIRYCGGCHDSPESLVDGYLDSEHGRALLLSGLIDAPSCSDCHGGHDILEVANDRAPTAHANSPAMCGECHLLLLDVWQTASAHGAAWQQGEDGPVCVDCHASHAIRDPAAPESRLASAGNCGECHADFLTTFRDSFHGKANDLGFVSGATCADCHSPHRNLPAADSRSSVHPNNLADTCGTCHDNVNASFITFDPHNDPTDPNDNFPVYVVWLFMTGLLVGVFGFFGVHDLLWLQRSLVGAMRGEFREQFDNSGRYVRRFSSIDMRMHVVIVVTFLLLALTGLPLKFHSAGWAQGLIDLLGGVDLARVIHRIAAIGTFGYASFHLGHLLVRWAIRREPGLFWGASSMVPQPRDVADLYANIRYFLYLGERPSGDRWTYFEKFDYLAVFWGVMIIGLSGLVLWLPAWFSGFLPGWALNAAYVIHSDEALLATGFIFIFHFFHTHLRPESFPMDVVIFTGKMPLQKFQSERPLEYQRLVEANDLDDYLVDAPTRSQLRNAYVWGSIFLTIGVLLAVGIIWALITQ